MEDILSTVRNCKTEEQEQGSQEGSLHQAAANAV
jgi:hypothetical protein